MEEKLGAKWRQDPWKVRELEEPLLIRLYSFIAFLPAQTSVDHQMYTDLYYMEQKDGGKVGCLRVLPHSTSISSSIN